MNIGNRSLKLSEQMTIYTVLLDILLIGLPFYSVVYADNISWLLVTLMLLNIIGMKVLAKKKIYERFSKEDPFRRTFIWKFYDVLSDVAFVAVWLHFGFIWTAIIYALNALTTKQLRNDYYKSK
jgi:hypothetical protein